MHVYMYVCVYIYIYIYTYTCVADLRFNFGTGENGRACANCCALSSSAWKLEPAIVARKRRQPLPGFVKYVVSPRREARFPCRVAWRRCPRTRNEEPNCREKQSQSLCKLSGSSLLPKSAARPKERRVYIIYIYIYTNIYIYIYIYVCVYVYVCVYIYIYIYIYLYISALKSWSSEGSPQA